MIRITRIKLVLLSLMRKNERLHFSFYVILLSKVLLSSVWLFFLQSCHFREHTPGTFTFKANSTYQENLAANAHHFYQVRLKKNEYFSILIDSPEIDGCLSLYDPQGIVMQSINFYQGGSFPLSLLATQEGLYRFDLSSSEKELSGAYTIQVLEYRGSNASDNIRIAATAAFIKGELARYGPNKDLLRTASAAFNQSVTAWQQIGEKNEAAKALYRIGEIAQILGNVAEAKESYRQALNLCDGDLRLKIDIGNNLFPLDSSKKDLQKNLESYLELSRQLKYEKGEAQVISSLARLAKSSSNQQEAIGKYQQAISIWQRLKNRRGQAQAFYELGTIYPEQSQAEQFCVKAFMLWQACNDKRGQARALASAGHCQSRIGNMQEASNYYRTAFELAKEFGDESQMISIANGWGYLYENYGEYDKALQQYRNALNLSQITQNVKNVAIALIEVGSTLRLIGNHVDAHATLLQAVRLAHQFPQYEAYAVMYLGANYHAQGRDTEALRNFQHARKLMQTLNEDGGVAEISNEIGNLYAERHQNKLARQEYLSALSLFQKNNEPFNICQTHFLLAKLAYKSNHLDEALAHVQPAISIIEDLRANIQSQTLRTSYLAAVNNSYQLNTEILMRKAKTHPLNNFVAAALQISEQSRARSFLDSLNEVRANLEKDLDPKVKARKQELFVLLSAKTEKRKALLSGDYKQEDLDTLNKEISELELQSDNLQMQIHAASPRYSALTVPQPLDANQIQQLLDSETLLLEYALGEEHSYLWAVTPDSVVPFTLPKRSEIEGLVRALHDLMKVREPKPGETIFQHAKRKRNADTQYPKLAAKLSQILLQPVAHKLSNKKLVIVGDGALHYLPFAVLPERGVSALSPNHLNSNSQKANKNTALPLMVNHEITMLPSASALKLLRDDRAGKPAKLDSVAVLADPVFNLTDERIVAHQTAPTASSPGSHSVQTRVIDLFDENFPIARLEQTRAEANAIRALVAPQQFLLKTDFAVNRAVFDSGELNPFSILHVATHGYVDVETPDASGIVLSRYDAQGRNQKAGILQLRSLYELKLPKELVVLSACETAWGKEIKGEGIIALSRGFFYAGAQRVMASLWSVEENATQILMAEFYRQLLKEKKTPAAALQAAQIAMWQKNPTKAPYDWAAFVLQGEYR